MIRTIDVQVYSPDGSKILHRERQVAPPGRAFRSTDDAIFQSATGNAGELGLDIRFRMLQPHELAAAIGFPPDYRFSGNKGDQVRQIGNAVSVRTARALCAEVLP